MIIIAMTTMAVTMVTKLEHGRDKILTLTMKTTIIMQQ